MDGVWVEKQNFDILLMGRKQFKQAYEIDVNSPKFGYSSVPGQRYLTRDVRVGVEKWSDAVFGYNIGGVFYFDFFGIFLYFDVFLKFFVHTAALGTRYL